MTRRSLHYCARHPSGSRFRSFSIAIVATALSVGCDDSSNSSTKHDAAVDKPSDGPRVDVAADLKKDVPLPTDTIACSLNGQTYPVGATVQLPGQCTTCRCQTDGTLGQCTGGCGLDASPDERPTADAPITCQRGNQSYDPGQIVPLGDGCGGTCVCMADGHLGQCANTCPLDGPLDRPDGPADRPPPEAPVEVPPIDTACAVGTACTLATGGRGLCPAGTCKACAGAQDDAACAAIYGAGTICAGGECVTGTCHDSAVCTGGKVCDSTHTCRNCASDLQCQNDASYGRGTLCLSSGACAAGTCHTSSDCPSKRLCDAAVHSCSACTTDAQCQADPVYGAKSICVASQCVAGTCATTADCQASGRLCPSATKICTACGTDAECRGDSAYGAGNICVDGQCVSGSCTTSRNCPDGRICNGTSRVCVACRTDTQCENDAFYGQHTLCLGGGCVTGDCHDDSADCSTGRICGSTVPHACGDCSSDAQCAGDDRYDSGYICVGNLCVQGDCHDNSNDCKDAKAGLVCGADAAHACGTCNSDEQCKNDPKYGASTICTRTGGLTTTGKCVSNACTNNGQACAANSADFCCSSKCVPGNCCSDAHCTANPTFGEGYFCRQNTCTRCDEATGGAYLVDPIAGDDGIATGSSTAGGVATPGCAFRTLTRALEALGGTAAAGTTLTIVGRSGGTTNLYTVAAAGAPAPEALPIQIPANVTVTTKTGPVKLTLANNKVGFNLVGDKARLMPAADALLTIDGGSHVSGAGIVITAGTGTATLSNVTVTNTGDDGIQVTSGTATLGAGVRVSGAGTASSRQNGLYISGGTVNITVAAAGPATVFESNTQSGIALAGAAVLNVSGATVTTGVRTVVAQNNYAANVDFGQVPVTATPVSTLDGLYGFASTTGDGLLVLAGSKLKVRGSVFLGNAGNGIRIAASSTDNTVANIDLGVPGAAAGNAGKNVLQTAAGSNPNVGAGLCVDLGTDAAEQTLRAAGNQFAGRDCSAASPDAIRLSASCTGATDLAIPTSADTVSVDTSTCTQSSS